MFIASQKGNISMIINNLHKLVQDVSQSHGILDIKGFFDTFKLFVMYTFLSCWYSYFM